MGRPGRRGRRHEVAEQPDREVRPGRLRRRQAERLSHRAAPRAASPRVLRGRCPSGSPSAQSGSVSSMSNALTSRLRAASSRTELKIGSNGNSGSSGEVHLRDQPLGERATEEREVDVRRPPRVRMVPPRVDPGLDRDEPVPTLVVGQAAARAGEVRVERRVVGVDVVEVSAGRVRLPDLDELAAERLAVARRARGPRPRSAGRAARRRAAG